MTKIRFNRLLSVVLALVMLATMMSFVFTANAADVPASVYEDLTYTTWPALGIDSNSATSNANATANYSDSKVGGWGTADGSTLIVNGSKTFDFSNGFSFNWKMGLGPYAATRDFNCMMDIGDLRFLLGNGSTLKLTVQKKGTSTKYIDATALTNKGVQAFSISVTADGKLSVAVNDDEIAQTNIDVSAHDFSNVSFSLVSWFGYSGGSGAGQTDGCIFQDPTLTVKKVPTKEAKKSVNVNTWTDLGLVDAVPNVYNTTVTANASTISGAQGSMYDADYAINACKVFDLSGGFTFTWTMGHSWNNPETYDAVSIGDLTILAKKNSNRTRTLYVVKNGGNNKVQGSIYYGRNPVTAVYGTVLDGVNGVTVPVSSTDKSNARTYTVTVNNGKLSLTVTHDSENVYSVADIDVSTIDFSAVTFGIKSAAGNSQGPNNHTSPSLTYNKTVQLVENSVNTLTGLDLTSANIADVTVNNKWTTSFSADDKTVSGTQAGIDWTLYQVDGKKAFDLSSGFTFDWAMGLYGYNTGMYNKDYYYNQLQIGNLVIKSQNNNNSGATSTITVKNGSTVIATNAAVPNANIFKDYSMTVADGKLTLSVTYNNVTTVVFGGDTAVDVRTIDFSAATFSVSFRCGYAQGAKFTINQLTIPTEVPDRINFVVTKGGQGLVKCEGKNWIDRYVAAGTQVTLTAEAAYGYTFQGWVNGVNNTVVSTDPTLTVRANTTNNYTAVFVKDSGKYTVTVLNRFGKVVATASVAADGKYTLPAAVDVTGYTFRGWQVKDSEDTNPYAAGAEYTVTGNVIFVPVYDVVETPTTYTISVTGGRADKTNALYNELVTVTADDVDNFGYWTKNGVVVSYSSTYSFYAGLANGTDINLVAVADTASAAPVTSIVNVYGSTAKVTFLMERSVPDGYSLVESGFILAKADFGTTDYMSAVDGATVIKVAASNTSANGQYMLNVKTTTGNAIYAVSYVTYVDASGKLHTVYSTAASANAQ